MKGCSCGGACNHMQVDIAFDEETKSSEERAEEDLHESYPLDSSFDEDHRDNFEPKACLPDVEQAKKARPGKNVPKKIFKSDPKIALSNIENALSSGFKCCKTNCVNLILTRADMLTARVEFLQMDRERQAQWLLNFFQLCLKKRSGKDVYEYRIEGKDVCQKAWIFAYGLSYGRFHDWKNQYIRGIKNAIHGRTGLQRKSERFMEAELWFQEYSTSMGNRMPDTTRVELPACETVTKVYCAYAETVKCHLKKTQFETMWKETFPEVVIPKRNRFSKCGVCLLISDHIRETKNEKNKISWVQRKKLHMDQQAGERKKYYKHQKKAEEEPDKYLSVIIDGMDQSKTGIPHWVQSSKLEGDNDHFMKTHVTGILSHGLNLAMCFIDFLRWPQDSNTTVNFLTSCFRQILQSKGRLPPTLYLQLDNCYRDCKNVYILGFCSLLVKAGVFKKVRLSYLMVGHTHEDIDQVSQQAIRSELILIRLNDQMFSRISVALNRNKAVTRQQLQAVIHGAFTPTPITSFVENIYDIKSWIRPYIATFRNHSHPHAFRFKLNGQGEVEMTYRHWANSGRKEWFPKAPSTFVSLKTLPRGKPSILQPDLKKCPTVEKMKEAVRKMQPRMTGEELDWWEKMIDAESKKVENWNRLSQEDYRRAGDSFDLLTFRYQEPDPKPQKQDPDYDKRNAELLRLIDKKNNVKPVEIVKKAK